MPVHHGDEVRALYDNLWKIMNDAQIAIYSVDLRSTTASPPIFEGGVRPSDIGDPQFDLDAQAKAERADTTTTLQLFAENTGGRAFLGGSNLVESFRQAVKDDSSYYVLGYYAGRDTKPGWHPISLTTTRKGARLRYRNGFLRSTDTSSGSALAEMQLALTSPFDFEGMPVSIRWTGREAGKSPGKIKVQFELVLPANFASVDEADQNHMIIDIAALAKNAKGEVIADLTQRVDTHLKPEGLEQIQRNGMTYRNGLQLPPGDYSVRFVVRDSLAHRIGSVAAPVSVTAAP